MRREYEEELERLERASHPHWGALRIARAIEDLVDEVRRIRVILSPKLSRIQISLGDNMPTGPVTLNVGDAKTATVLGFDQNGQPMAIDFTQNPVTWTDDNTAVVAEVQSPDKDQLTAATAGSANLSASCAGFSDSVAITVVVPPPPQPVLSSVKISID